ncbi:MAG: Ig-like domain-containing protein, partial [Leptospiraceae bacterium]|nr:Ig-like domain-containing protein [Leptospiraceae bacterium]
MGLFMGDVRGILPGLLSVVLISCQAKPAIEEVFTLKDLTPPQVTFILPANGETEVTDKPTIVIGFNEPMDAGSLNSATVTIKTANGAPAVGKYEYDTSQNVLSIEIVERLYLNTQYTITVTDKVKDRAGNVIAPVSSSFTTDVCPKSRAQRPVFNGPIYAMAKGGC